MIAIIRAFLLGMREFRSSWGMTYPDLRESAAYDHGRELMHRLTLRRYEDWP